MSPKISVVIPTRGRPDKLRRTIDGILTQSLGREAFEVIVVDDGSDAGVTLGDAGRTSRLRLLRIAHGERSIARNRGAEAAGADLLAFLDDDMIVTSTFLQAHLDAQKEWPGVLAVGAVSLPFSVVSSPFGRFRAELERGGIPVARGIVTEPGFCTAANMSLPRQRFLDLGGFDREILSAEDQDLALRHSAAGGRITFIPEAGAIHDDDKLDIRSYCRRHEWGSEKLAPFCWRHPNLPETHLRVQANGPIRVGTDSVGVILKKSLRAALARASAQEAVFAVVALTERLRPSTRALPVLYRLLLGIHLQRGFRRGWAGGGPESRAAP